MPVAPRSTATATPITLPFSSESARPSCRGLSATSSCTRSRSAPLRRSAVHAAGVDAHRREVFRVGWPGTGPNGNPTATTSMSSEMSSADPSGEARQVGHVIDCARAPGRAPCRCEQPGRQHALLLKAGVHDENDFLASPPRDDVFVGDEQPVGVDAERRTGNAGRFHLDVSVAALPSLAISTG